MSNLIDALKQGKDIDFIKIAVYMILKRVDEETFAKYIYMFLYEHPDLVKKVYTLFKVGEGIIEQYFAENLKD